MKYFFFLIILFNILFCKLVYSKEIYVVSKVNNVIITNIDIDDEYRYLIALNNDLKNIDSKKVIKLAKNSIIREKIKETELMNHYDLSKPNKYITRIMKNFFNSLGIKTEEEFKKYLLNYGLSFEEVKKKIIIEAAWNDLIYQKYSKNIEIDESEVKKKVEKTFLNKKNQNIYLLSEILFNVNESENIDNKYKLIKKSIENVGFKNSANIYSISESGKLGGEIGWINENQLSKIIKEKIIKIKVGEYSEPITVPGGFLILKINDKKVKVKENNLNLKQEYEKQIVFEKDVQLNRFSKIYFNKIKKNSTISE